MDDLEERLSPQRTLFSETSFSSASLRLLRESREALNQRDATFFAERLSRQDHYRIACTFPNETLFLDIETTGLSRYYDYITMVGWSLGGEYDVFIRGSSDDKLRRALAQAKVLVTFNGTIFDLPFVLQEFHGISLPKAHVDLRFLGKRVGLSGGQKSIEEQLGLHRSSAVKDVSGEAAPVLWHRYRKGDLSSLKLLIEYNHADIEGMKQILDYSIAQFVRNQEFPKSLSDNGKFTTLKSQLEWHSGTVLSSGTSIATCTQKAGPAVSIDELDPHRLRVVGIDLTGSEARGSGWCVLEGKTATTKILYLDDEIVAETLKRRPDLVSIDSPLTLPAAKDGIMRFCERVLKRRGINVYPALIPSMVRLTRRGISLARRFRKLGIPVIESYPGAAQDVMNIPRKRASIEFLEKGLAEFGVDGDFLKNQVSHDELDAITSAIVGIFFWSGRFESLGLDQLGDEALIIPDLKVDPTGWQSRQVIGLSGPVSAGKTTAATFLERHGFYCGWRAQVSGHVDHGKAPQTGHEKLGATDVAQHKRTGQGSLRRALKRAIRDHGHIVIDGIRSMEDHAFLIEKFGPAFRHIHINAPFEVRSTRIKINEGTQADPSRPLGEGDHESLGKVAQLVVNNDGTLESFCDQLERVLAGEPQDPLSPQY